MLHMAGGTGTGTGTPQTHVSNIMSTTNLLHNQTQTQPLHSLFLSTAPTSFFTGSRSMVSFEDVKLQGGYNSSSNNMSSSFLSGYENGDDGMDDYNFHQPAEKKRRLSMDQVQFLEKSFEVENKLEPERKTKLAKDLGLQPRQVAIWFQNRRARWKTKQMEKDYDSLNHTYQTLKTDYDNLLKEKDRLQAQVASLTEKVVVYEKMKMIIECCVSRSGTRVCASLPPQTTSTIRRRTLSLSLISTTTFSALIFSVSPPPSTSSPLPSSTKQKVPEFSELPNSVGLKVLDLRVGSGEVPTDGDQVEIHYYGRLAAKQGWRFDSTYDHKDENGDPNPFVFVLGSGKVIAGIDAAVRSMKIGGIRRVIIPPSLGYQNTSQEPIPPNLFDRQRLFTTIFNPTRLAKGEGSTLGTVIFDIELVGLRHQ